MDDPLDVIVDPKLKEEIKSNRSIESITDTTVYNMDYSKTIRGLRNSQLRRLADKAERSIDPIVQPISRGKPNDQIRRVKARVITKSNQSTLTDRTQQCDVSTTTQDWWSPIIERKDLLKTNSKEKRRKDYQPRIRDRRTFRNRGMSTGDKIVAFRSRTQLIPRKESAFLDILSPSRYLLEVSLFYYNLFLAASDEFIRYRNR